MPNRIIISGASGFIGKYCLPTFSDRGFEVHAISTSKQGQDENGVFWHKLNLLEESSKDLLTKIQPTHFLHLAWYTKHGSFWSSDQNYKWLAVSKTLADDFMNAGGKRFVFSGSCAEYTWGGHCVEGITMENPSSVYGQCKKEFSDYLRGISIRNKVSYAIGRIFFLYGPGEPSARLVPAVINSCLNNDSIKSTDGLQVRDFMFVNDVANALVSLTCSESQGVVNIASGQALKIRDFIGEICKILGSKSNLEFGAIARGANDPDMLTASTNRLNQEIGYFPATTLKNGILSTAAWVKNLGAM